MFPSVNTISNIIPIALTPLSHETIPLTDMDISSILDTSWTFTLRQMTKIIGSALAAAITITLIQRRRRQRRKGGDMFDLQHITLNIVPEEINSWCNLGMWRKKVGNSTSSSIGDSTPIRYVDACAALVTHIADFAKVDSHSRILDVGCGCGDQDFLLIRGPWNVASIIAVNLSQIQIDWAKRRMEVEERKMHEQFLSQRITFHGGSGTELQTLIGSLPSALSSPTSSESSWSTASQPKSHRTFTHVLAIDCAYHFTPRTTFFSQAYAALEPGGRIAMADIILRLPEGCQNSNDLPWTWRIGTRFISWMCAVPLTNMCSEAEYISSLKDAGFTDVHVDDLTDDVFPGAAEFLERHPAQLREVAASWITSKMRRYAVTSKGLKWIYRNRYAKFIAVTARKPAG